MNMVKKSVKFFTFLDITEVVVFGSFIGLRSTLSKTCDQEITYNIIIFKTSSHWHILLAFWEQIDQLTEKILKIP